MCRNQRVVCQGSREIVNVGAENVARGEVFLVSELAWTEIETTHLILFEQVLEQQIDQHRAWMAIPVARVESCPVIDKRILDAVTEGVRHGIARVLQNVAADNIAGGQGPELRFELGRIRNSGCR